jgi:hypothetical protein
MSGGSMDYLYGKIQNDLNFKKDTPERKAFWVHMQKVIHALQKIEWADSGDTLPGEADTAAINECLQPGAVVEMLVEEAHNLVKQLQEAIEKTPQGRADRLARFIKEIPE